MCMFYTGDKRKYTHNIYLEATENIHINDYARQKKVYTYTMLGDNIKFTHALCWEINESLHINYAGIQKKFYSITIL